MTTSASVTDPLDRAILAVLGSLPETWQNLHPSTLPVNEEAAHRLLLHAGLEERLHEMRATMAGEPESVEFTCVVSGEQTSRAITAFVLRQMPRWLDHEGKTKGSVELECRGVQVRISAEGLAIREGEEGGGADGPLSLPQTVRRSGPWPIHRPPLPASFRLVSSRINTGQADGPRSDHADAGGIDTAGWLTVTNAAERLIKSLPFLNLERAKARVSKAATAEEFRTNGQSKHDRRIEPDSFNTWLLVQRDKDLDAES